MWQTKRNKLTSLLVRIASIFFKIPPNRTTKPPDCPFKFCYLEMQTILPGTMYPVRRNSQKKLSKLSSRLNKVGRLRMGHAKPAMIFTVLVLIYLTLGVIVLSCVAENWRIVDSLYFSMITLATVGYGETQF